MPLKLTISKKKDNEFHLERELEQDKITLGRDDTNLVVLPDDKKVVSREHAEIHFDNNTFYLHDKGSRNGTFINNNRLKPEHPYVLDDGSEFEIGEYQIKVTITKLQDARVEETVFVSNPFVDATRSLYDILKILEDKYSEEDPSFRDDLLKQSLDQIFEELGENEILNAIIATCSKPAEQVSDSVKTPSTAADSIPISTTDDDPVALILLDMLVKLTQVISKFRIEFVGATLVQTKDSLQIQSRESLQNYLFDPKLSAEDSKKRIHLLREEIEKTLMHQVALLDGYRGSIQDGVPELLKEVNPSIIKKELSKEIFEIGPIKIPKKIVPLLIELKAMQQVEKILYNLAQEDRGIFEKKYFRPAFIKNYLETVSSAQKMESKSDKSDS
jgi:predicted component of type VI protein secretion system